MSKKLMPVILIHGCRQNYPPQSSTFAHSPTSYAALMTGRASSSSYTDSCYISISLRMWATGSTHQNPGSLTAGKKLPFARPTALYSACLSFDSNCIGTHKPIHPRQIFDTLRPLFPSRTYCIFPLEVDTMLSNVVAALVAMMVDMCWFEVGGEFENDVALEDGQTPMTG